LNGTCYCNSNYYGLTCNESCSCINGECDHLNGTCYCINNFVGVFCDIRCLDSDCKTNCTCNNTNACSNETLCTDEVVNISNNITIVSNSTTSLNNLNVIDTSIFVVGSIIILGNASFENSLLSFNTSYTIIKGDLSFSISSITFSNSTILVNGCVYLKNNTHLTIDFSKYIIGEQNTNITLIQSSNSCLNKEGIIEFKYINQPTTPCSSITNNINSNSISIIFKFYTCESSIGIKLQSSNYFIKIWIFTFLHIVGAMI